MEKSGLVKERCMNVRLGSELAVQVMLMTIIWANKQHQNSNNVGDTNDLILDLKKLRKWFCSFLKSDTSGEKTLD
jgi:hypothetical protein